jgi:hypothetical protein
MLPSQAGREVTADVTHRLMDGVDRRDHDHR